MNMMQTTGAQRAVLVDIDGTLAHFDPEEVREWVLGETKMWPEFFAHMRNAPVRAEVLELVNILRESGQIILLCSGRPMEYIEETVAWLEANNITYHGIYLRKAGDDARKDEDVKAELLAEIHKDGYQPWLVIDDRTAVVNHWRALGLCCLQCAPGDF